MKNVIEKLIIKIEIINPIKNDPLFNLKINGIIIDNSDFAIIRFSEEFAEGKYDIKVLKFNLSKKPFEINDPISNILKVIED